MPKKNVSGKYLDEIGDLLTSDDLLGKEVIDESGLSIGVSEKVFIDQNLNFIGISVDKGLLKRGLTIGKDYIERVAPYAIFLKIRVAYEMKGMDVFDSPGKKVGKVKEVELIGNKNAIKSLIVSSGFKSLNILPEFIDRIGYNVLLNVSVDEIKKQNRNAY